MISTLLATNPDSSDVATMEFTSGIDSTYDHYLFVLTGIHPETDGTYFGMQFNASGQSGYNEVITSAVQYTNSQEGSTDATFDFAGTSSLGQASTYQRIAVNVGADNDQSVAGIVHLFQPANTTYVTHFTSRCNSDYEDNYMFCYHTSGYINVTAAITGISFKFESGNMNGTIQMYGIA